MENNSDVQAVLQTASVLHISEFEVFCLAYRRWFGQPAAPHEMDACFGSYLRQATVPPWVRAFTRQVHELQSLGRLDPRAFGVGPAPLVSLRKAFFAGMGFAFILVFVFLIIFLAAQTDQNAVTPCQFPPCY